jgi:OPA family glycerol-3-phosphate transporter-like MFS transporter
MDFGGKRNVGVAVGIIDGFVYLGTAVMAITYGWALPEEQFDPTGALTGPVTDPANWLPWPVIMIPVALIGFLLATRVWNAKPKSGAVAPAVVPVEEPVAMLPGAPTTNAQPAAPPTA